MSADSPIFPEGLKDYIDSFGYTESKLLKENREETRELGAISIMQIGAAQGAFLSILCKIANFKKIDSIIKKKGRIRKIIMEGGAFDVNGSGTILLTEECLLSKIQERKVTKLGAEA